MLAKKIFPVIGSAVLAAGVLSATQSAVASTVLHKVVDVVLESGNPGNTISKGYTTLETATVNCPHSSCTLGMNIMSAVGEATCTNEWAIIGLVDGNSVDGGPYIDGLPHSGNVQTRNWQGEYQVTSGSHTIAFQLYVPCDVNADQWSVDYMVTTP